MSADNVLRVPRETNEFQAVEVFLDQQLLTGGLHYALTPGETRPAVWHLMETADDGRTGFRIQGMTPGTYKIWIRHTAGDMAVRFAGLLVVQ